MNENIHHPSVVTSTGDGYVTGIAEHDHATVCKPPTYVYQLRSAFGVDSEHPTMDSAIAAKWKKLYPGAYWVNAKAVVLDDDDAGCDVCGLESHPDHAQHEDDEGRPLQAVDCE